MLEATGWLLRLQQVPDATLPALLPTLQALAESDERATCDAAVEALGFVGQSFKKEQFLWKEEEKEREEARAEAHQSLVAGTIRWLLGGARGAHPVDTIRARALARLSAAASDETLRAEVCAALRATLPDTSAVAGLVRLLVVTSVGERARDWEAERGAALLNELHGLLPDAETLLAAFLAAGTDDDGWGEYHERLAQLVRRLAESDPSILPELLSRLEEAYEIWATNWPPQRMALAAVAACAPALGDALNEALAEGKLEALLLASTQVAGSFTARRQAITALSYLRYMTPAALEALLKAGSDVGIVQRDAVAAVERFQYLSEDFGREEALAPLAAALTGESLARAYLAAQLLAALGRSPVALQQPTLRLRIGRLLGEAWQRADVSQHVYLLSPGGTIEDKGTLSEALLTALGRVVALPE